MAGSPVPRGGTDLLRVEGAEQLRDLAHHLRAMGDGALLKELTKELRLAAKPVVPATRNAALATLPKSGGLATLVSKHPQRITVRAGNTTARVSVSLAGSRKGSGASQSDTGTVRHPVFNRLNAQGRRIFVAQPVRPGWFSRTAEFLRPSIQRQVGRVLDDVARRAGFPGRRRAA